jgi:hopanoid biosynthesis associated RND transporter like protein HpnN
METIKNLSLSFLHYWIAFVERFRYAVVIFFALFILFAINYTANNLGMNTSTTDMLSPELLWRQLDIEYTKKFPYTADNIVVVIEARTPDQAQDAATKFHSALIANPDLFTDIYYPNGLPLFKDSALLYLDKPELHDLSDNLAVVQPFLARLTDDQSLRGLFGMISEAIDAIEDGEKVDLKALLEQINIALIAGQYQQPFRLSWQNMMRGETEESSVYREFLILQPVMEYSSLFPAEEAITALRNLARDLELEKEFDARLRLTGNAVLAHEDLLSVTRGTEIAMVVALIMVTLIMSLGLGSIRLVFATLVTLVTGLITTAAFAALAVGELNLISVAFAVLYIGLGVDFAIHYCLRYRELRFQGQIQKDAIASSSSDVGGALLLCALTTAIGFFAFIPTSYLGVAQLGIISGGGMFISLIITMTLLPAILSIIPHKELKHSRLSVTSDKYRQYLLLPIKHAPGIRITFAVIAVVFLYLLTQVKFDPNTLNIQDPDNESVQTYKDLLSDRDTSPWTGIILLDDRDEAARVKSKLEVLPLVDKVLWIEDFIPEDQDDKLFIIDEMYLLLGEISPPKPYVPLDSDEQFKSISSLLEKLSSMENIETVDELPGLRDNLRDYTEYLSILDDKIKVEALNDLETSLLASLPPRLETLQRSLAAEPVSYEQLPETLISRWQSSSGTYLLEIYPRENIQDNDSLRRFVNQIKSADQRIIGTPVISIEASDAVVESFQQAFLYAFIAIMVFLVVLLDRKKDVLYVIAPLLIAAICTGGISFLLGISFNFANIIALPLILGIGVDSGIHILHRFRTALPADHNLLATSSARAVFVSAMTTMCSIGALAVSPHLGTASMGILLTIGVGMTIVAMLIFLPSLLASELNK